MLEAATNKSRKKSLVLVQSQHTFQTACLSFMIGMERKENTASCQHLIRTGAGKRADRSDDEGGRERERERKCAGGREREVKHALRGRWLM